MPRLGLQDLQDLKDGQEADTMLNHMLKDVISDATGCIELFCQQRPSPDADALLSTASDILFRGLSQCNLRDTLLDMAAGRYEPAPSDVNLRTFAQQFVRGRQVALECPSKIVKVDAVACNVILDSAITSFVRHACPEGPEVCSDKSNTSNHPLLELLIRSAVEAIRTICTSQYGVCRRWTRSERATRLYQPSDHSS